MTVRIDQSIESASTLLESEMIKHALRSASGLTEAAASLGISRKGLYLKRVRLGLLNFGGRVDVSEHHAQNATAPQR